MNKDNMRAAVKEAERFLKAADAVEDKLKDSPWAGYAFFGCKETGALRRASLDLTRSLAEMRKSN